MGREKKLGFGAQGRHLKGDRTAWEGNGSHFFRPHPTALDPTKFSSVGKRCYLFGSFPFQFSSVLLISFSLQFSSPQFQFTSLRFTSVRFISLRFASIPLSFQFSSVQPSSVQLLVTSRAVAVHFSVGEGTVLFVSFPSQFSPVRFTSLRFTSLRLASDRFGSVQFGSDPTLLLSEQNVQSASVQSEPDHRTPLGVGNRPFSLIRHTF